MAQPFAEHIGAAASPSIYDRGSGHIGQAHILLGHRIPEKSYGEASSLQPGMDCGGFGKYLSFSIEQLKLSIANGGTKFL